MINKKITNLRYAFLKRKYHNYLVLIRKKNKYRTYCDDKYILDYITHLYNQEKKEKRKNKKETSEEKMNLINFIKSLNINYVLLGINNDVKIYDAEINNYNIIKYKAFTYKILEKTRRVIENKG